LMKREGKFFFRSRTHPLSLSLLQLNRPLYAVSQFLKRGGIP
jgi:hypothetical protein